MASMDYNAILLEAMRTVVDAEMKKLTFDKTIKCEVIDDTFKADGKYTVYDGSVKMEAYCDTANKYVIGDKVYVTVPLGDYTQKKIISSKYIENDDNKPITYVPPLSTVMDMSGNIIPSEPDTAPSILANGVTLLKRLYHIDLTQKDSNNMPKYGISPQETRLYDTIGLSADFQTMLDDKDVQQGSYGLLVDLFHYVNKNNSETYENFATITFDSSQMFGNPYSFTLPLTQSIKFDKGDKLIWGLNIYLYQKGNFQYYDDGKYERYSSTIQEKNLDYQGPGDAEFVEVNKADNIFVSNINISLGRDLIKLTDDTFTIYTYDENNEYDINDNGPRSIYASWINKDPETNAFIGFSDGIVDKEDATEPYDEIKYLTTYENNYAGSAVVISPEDEDEENGNIIPKIKESLQIYANAKQITQEIKKIKNYVETDLNTQLDALSRNALGYGISETDIGALRSPVNAAIEDICKKINIEPYGDLSIEKQYVQYLWSKNSVEEPEDNQTEGENNPIEKAKNIYKDIRRSVSALINNFVEEIEDNQTEEENKPGIIQTLYTNLDQYSNIKAYAQQFKILVDKIIANINSSITILNRYITDDNGLQPQLILSLEGKYTNNNTQTFEEEYNAFLEANKNKYCIYWYHYEKGYADESDKFYQKDWRRITFENTTTPLPGMPAVEIIKGERKYTKTSEVPLVISSLNTDLTEERYKAILFFNHKRINSNDLVFKNQSTTSSEVGEDINDALYIEVGAALDNSTSGKANSMEVHQLYNSYYTLLKASDAYLNRKIRVRFEGVQGGDEIIEGGQVFWYIPTQATMLNYDLSRLQSEGFSLVIENEDTDYASYYRPGYACFCKTIGPSLSDNPDQIINNFDKYFWYQIKNIYNSSWTNNEIICKVVKDGLTYTATKMFAFSTYGNNGTDYTLSITPVENQLTTSDELLNIVSAPSSSTGGWSNSLIANKNTINEELTTGTVIFPCYYLPKVEDATIYIRNQQYNVNKNGAAHFYDFSSIVSVAAGQTIQIVLWKGRQNQGFGTPEVLLEKTYEQANLYLNRVRFEIDDTVDFFSVGVGTTNADLKISAFKLFEIYPLRLKTVFSDFNGDALNAIASWGWYGPHQFNVSSQIADGEALNDNEINIVGTIQDPETDCLYNVVQASISWGKINATQEAAGGNLNLTALYPIPYSTGNYYIDGPSTIIYNALGTNPQYYNGAYKIYNKNNNTELTDVTWEIYHYKIDDKGRPQKYINSQDRYLPKLKSGNGNDNGYYLMPLTIYISDNNIYSVVVCKQNSTIIYAQPLYIGQNRYGSPMLNTWDEELTIDNENGTIMASMLGAGHKDSNNAFYGVLMGDVGVKTEDETIVTAGIYGFHAGAQSFGWKADGTGFIGKSGHGRIEFDGNNGVIRSSNWNEQTPRGMQIDLDDAIITIRGEDNEYTANHENEIIIQATSPYLTVNGNAGKPIIFIGNEEMYLQSNDYIGSPDNSNEQQATGMRINLNQGSIDAYNFNLTSRSITISSNGDPYIEVKHSYTDGKNGTKEQPVLRIASNEQESNVFQIKSLPFNQQEKEAWAAKVASGHTLTLYMGITEMTTNDAGNEQEILKSVSATSTKAKSGDYIALATESPFTFDNPSTETWELWYKTIDGYYICCLGASHNNSVYFLELKERPASHGNTPNEYKATAVHYTNAQSAYMEMDVQKAKLTFKSGAAPKFYDVENNTEIPLLEAEQKELIINATEILTPFRVGTFKIDWDGKIYSKPTGQTWHNWYINSSGGAYFSWLSTGSLSCSSLTINKDYSINSNGYFNGTASKVNIGSGGQWVADNAVVISGTELRDTGETLNDIIKDRIKYFVKAEAIKNMT